MHPPGRTSGRELFWGRFAASRSFASSAARQRSAGFPLFRVGRPVGLEAPSGRHGSGGGTGAVADRVERSRPERMQRWEKGEARGERAAELVVFRSFSVSKLQIPSICIGIRKASAGFLKAGVDRWPVALPLEPVHGAGKLPAW